MRIAELDLIRELALFRGMKPAHFEYLMGAAFLQRFPEQIALIEEGDEPDFLHIVVEGTVELFAKHEERETTLDLIAPVTTFILAAVVRDEIYLKSARTLTSSRILMIPAAAVREVFGRDATFARAVVEELALRYRGMVRTLKNERLRTSAERLANWILKTSRQHGDADKFQIPYDKRTLAALLGMTPENLSRNLAFLTDHGVSNHGRQVVIEDLNALTFFARPNILIDG